MTGALAAVLGGVNVGCVKNGVRGRFLAALEGVRRARLGSALPDPGHGIAAGAGQFVTVLNLTFLTQAGLAGAAPARSTPGWLRAGGPSRADDDRVVTAYVGSSVPACSATMYRAY